MLMQAWIAFDFDDLRWGPQNREWYGLDGVIDDALAPREYSICREPGRVWSSARIGGRFDGGVFGYPPSDLTWGILRCIEGYQPDRPVNNVRNLREVFDSVDCLTEPEPGTLIYEYRFRLPDCFAARVEGKALWLEWREAEPESEWRARLLDALFRCGKTFVMSVEMTGDIRGAERWLVPTEVR